MDTHKTLIIVAAILVAVLIYVKFVKPKVAATASTPANTNSTIDTSMIGDAGYDGD